MFWVSNIPEGRKAAVGDEDLQYVMLCQKGDVEAFAVLVERHQKKMLNIAYRMTGDYDEACDVTQEAFIAAYKSIKSFKAEAKFSTWLYRIVINCSKNLLKQLQGKSRHESIVIDDSGEEKIGGTNHPLPSHEDNPGATMERREREAHVQKCVNSLDHEYREVLVLRDIQGFSYEEISDMLSVPDGTVKSRLSRARSALKDCLKKVMGDL